jgi:DNA-binding PadR family transcriptional regulator
LSTNTASGDGFLPLLARDFYILFFLAQRDRHGYGLVKAIEEHSQGAVRLDPANLYRAIQKLADAGLVADGAAPATAEAARPRRYYAITDLGREVVAAEATRMRDLAAAAIDANLVPGSEG